MTTLKAALRALRGSPGFSAIVILTMAVGIAANTAIFSVYDQLVLHPVTIPDPSSLVAIWFNNPHRNIQTFNSSIPRYDELRAEAKSFSSVALSAFDSFTLTGIGDATQLNSRRVSASFFPTPSAASGLCSLAPLQNGTSDPSSPILPSRTFSPISGT